MTVAGTILLEAFAVWLWLMLTPTAAALVVFKYLNRDWNTMWNLAIIGLLLCIANCFFGYIILPGTLDELERLS